MNRSSSGSSSLPLFKALIGFLNAKAAEGLSDGTLTNYEFRLKQCADFTGDPAIESITPQGIREYLVWLRTDYRPRRYNGDRSPLSPKTIRHGPMGGAKGGKGRIVFLGRAARRSVWRHLAERADGDDPTAPLFTGRGARPLRSDSLRQLTKSIAARAGVDNCFPHRFRHTFALTYLRAGGDIFTLQAILGHSTSNAPDEVENLIVYSSCSLELAAPK